MIRKFVAEPSDKMNGLYDVTKFNEEKQVYLPIERDIPVSYTHLTLPTICSV